MERLSFFDQVAHKISTSGLPDLNMQGAMILDPAKSPYKIDAQIIAEHIAARLIEFPILRKKLVQDPLGIGDLRLVDDPDFDVWNHITFASLVAPGDQDCLHEHLAHFSAQGLDFSRPLWRFEIIEGLQHGKIALVQKLSHATMDGMAAFKIMQTLFDREPTPPAKLGKQSWTVAPEPGRLKLLASALQENVVRLGVRTPRTLWYLSREIGGSAVQQVGARFTGGDTARSGKENKKSKLKARPTSLNGAISSDRRALTYASFELDKLKTISKSLDCKLNDVCLVMTSEALATYFRGIGEKIDFDLVFAMPISTRAAAEKEHGNALTIALINAHNTIPALPERLQAIQADTLEAKIGQKEKQASKKNAPDITGILSPVLIDLATALLQKIQPWSRLPSPVNAAMTNVPGPPWTFFFAGMPIEYQIPIIPVFHKGALSIGATSMGNNFSFGFHACGRVVKQENMHFLTEGLSRAYEELAGLAKRKTRGEGTSRPARRKSPGKKAALTINKAKPKTRVAKSAASVKTKAGGKVGRGARKKTS
jgi:WS/DGAT/MGAT family acyltransferase